MKRCIITGMVDIKYWVGITMFNEGFYCLNGDIETNSNGEEVYITCRQKKDSSESEEVTTLVKDLPKQVQEYIAKHKRYVNRKE